MPMSYRQLLMSCLWMSLLRCWPLLVFWSGTAGGGDHSHVYGRHHESSFSPLPRETTAMFNYLKARMKAVFHIPRSIMDAIADELPTHWLPAGA